MAIPNIVTNDAVARDILARVARGEAVLPQYVQQANAFLGIKPTGQTAQVVAATPAPLGASLYGGNYAALPQTYTAGTQAALDAARAAAAKVSGEIGATVLPDVTMQRSLNLGIANLPVYATEQNVSRLGTSGLAPEQQLRTLLEPTTNAGNLAGQVMVGYDQPVRLTDAKGNVIYEGKGYQDAVNAVNYANQISKDQGKAANWKIDVMQGDKWATAARDQPPDKTLGMLQNLALGTVGGIVAGPLGAAATSGGLTAARGGSLGDVLKNAAVSGLTSYAGGQLMGAATGTQPQGLLGPLGGSPAGSTLGGFDSAALDAYMAPILQSTLGSTAGGALGSAAGGAAGSAFGDALGEILVTGTRNAAPSILSSAVPALASGALGGALLPNGEISDISVTARQPEAPAPGAPALGGGLTAPITTPIANPQPDIKPIDTPDLTKTSIMDRLKGLDVSDWMMLGGGLLGLLGGSGAPTGQQGVMPGGMKGGLNPIFSAQLPPPSSVGGGLGPQAVQPRQMNEDWNTYGFRPERSFFTNVPQRNYAKGGEVEGEYAVRSAHPRGIVNGEGTGRSDDITAGLSDGEYVIDAETVALLGDGSTRAGADALDAFRVNIRKHKGKKLAKGKFSDHAKQPHAYLPGGKR